MPLAAALNAPRLHGFSPVRPSRAGLPLVLLRFSPPHKSPPPDTAHRAAPLRYSSTTSVVLAKPWAGVRRQRHCAALRTQGSCRARAARASTSDSRRLFERSERSERSEFRGPRDEHRRDPEQSGGRRTRARRIPARGFARSLSKEAEMSAVLPPLEPAAAPRPAAGCHRLDRGDRGGAGDHRRHPGAQPCGEPPTARSTSATTR